MRIINDLISGVLGIALLYLLFTTGDPFYGGVFIALALLTGVSIGLRRV